MTRPNLATSAETNSGTVSSGARHNRSYGKRQKIRQVQRVVRRHRIHSVDYPFGGGGDLRNAVLSGPRKLSEKLRRGRRGGKGHQGPSQFPHRGQGRHLEKQKQSRGRRIDGLRLQRGALATLDEKYQGGFRLPSRFDGARGRRCRRGPERSREPGISRNLRCPRGRLGPKGTVRKKNWESP